jgi:hypothetical protein
VGILDIILRLAALGTAALHLFAGWLPEDSAWGIWHYTALPRPLAWLGMAVVVVLAIGSVNDAVRRWAVRLWDWLPGQSHSRRWFAGLALASAIPFWLFRIQHLRWGDAEFIVKALAYTGADRPVWTIYNWQSPLTIYLHARLWLLLNPQPGIRVETLYALTSVLAGVGFVYLTLCLTDILGRDRLEKTIIFGLVATTGSMQLFFGYIENYTLMSLGVMLTLYLGVRCLHRELSPAWPSLALAVTNAFHPSTIVLWPAVLYLGWRATHVGSGVSARSPLTWVRVTAPPVLVFAALAAFMAAAGHGPAALLTDDRPGGADGIPFVPLFEVTTEWQYYTLFSATHLLEWANEHFLISPFGLLLLICALLAVIAQRVSGKARGQVAAGSDGGITILLTIASAAYLLLTFVWNPDYGMRKDWDLFAPSAFVYTTLAAHGWVRGQASDVLGRRLSLARSATLLIAAAALHTAAWVYYNTMWR